jgi:hypothetical protein
MVPSPANELYYYILRSGLEQAMDGEIIPPRDRAGRFAPGASGNPGGRTPVPAHIKEALESHTEKAVAVLAELLSSDDDRVRCMAANSLLDRCFGKPVAQLDAKVQGGGSGAAHLAALLELSRRTAEEQAIWAAEHAERTRQRRAMYLARLDRETAVEEAQAIAGSSKQNN